MNIEDLSKQALKIRDLYSQFETKTGKKSWTTLNLMDGFVGDVGELMKIVMAKEGYRDMDDVDDKLRHELSDCLYVILVLAKRYDIDLENGFLETMENLKEDINNKLNNQ